MFDYVFECFDGGDWDDFSDIWLELLSLNHYHVVCFEEGGTMLTRRSCRSIVRRRQNSPRDFNRIVPTILQDSQDSLGSNSSWDSSQCSPRSLRCQSFQGVGGVNLGSFCHWWYFFFHQQTQMTVKKKMWRVAQIPKQTRHKIFQAAFKANLTKYSEVVLNLKAPGWVESECGFACLSNDILD